MNAATRRMFLRGAAIGSSGLLCRDWLPGWSLPTVSAAESQLTPQHVQFADDIEPLVRLLEETPQERLLEEVGQRVRQGLSYRPLLSALFLAGIRNVQPRPAVGFKFHAVMVVHSAHLAALASRDDDRWLPLFWALDAFKRSQARDVEEGNWTMPAVREDQLPGVEQAVMSLEGAMTRWDEAAADVAAAQLARTHSADQLFGLFARFGCRDFRSIGHKIIYVANAFRTLDTIGWRHAEPVMRSLAYALLNHEGEPNPGESDLDADRPGRQNVARRSTIRAGWQWGQHDEGATRDLLTALRTNNADDVSQMVVEQLNRNVSPQSIFDAYFLAAGEMLMRQPGIVALHASTTTNAMRYAFDRVDNDETRQLLLLQNGAFLTLFRDAMKQRGAMADVAIDQLEPVSGEATDLNTTQVFASLHADRIGSAKKLLAGIDRGLAVEEVMREARRLIFAKGDDSHDYKFSSAILEDYYHISPAWRGRCLAASLFQLRGADEPDNQLVTRIRQSLIS